MWTIHISFARRPHVGYAEPWFVTVPKYKSVPRRFLPSYPAQQVWLPGNDLQDPATWMLPPPSSFPQWTNCRTLTF